MQQALSKDGTAIAYDTVGHQRDDGNVPAVEPVAYRALRMLGIDLGQRGDPLGGFGGIADLRF